MRNNLMLMFIMVIMVFIMPMNSIADEVCLKNGDRLTGQVIRMEGGKLILKTSYAGEISMAWQEVASLKTDDSVKVVLKDETAFEGNTLPIEDGKMMLETANIEALVSFSLADVKAINPEPIKIVNITTRANVNITNERGNTDSDYYYFDGEFVARTKKNRYKIGGELSTKESDGTTTSRNWLTYGNYSHFLDKKWYLYADTLFQHDEFKDIDLRSTLGAGAGYQIFESPLLNLFVSVGLAMVNENFYVAEDDDYTAGQWSVNYDQYFFKKFVQLFHVNTGFVSFENTNNWFFRTRTGLRFPIYKRFTATLQYNYDYDHQPSEDAEEKEDTKFIFLLGYEFKN